MGHIAKVDPTRNFPKGGWKARYRDNDGKFHSKTFTRKMDADRYLARVTTELVTNDYVDPKLGRTTFGQVAADWLATKPARKERTRHGYEGLLRNHVLPHFGARPVAAITPGEIKDWWAKLEAQPDNAYRNVLKPILARAVEQNLIRTNPTTNLRLPKRAISKNEPMLFLTAEEVNQLARAIDKPYDVLVLFAAYTGLRAGEIGALRVKHLDMLRRRVTVAESASHVKGRGMVYGPTKTYKTRTVTLPAFLADALAAHLHAHPNQPLTPDTLVFTSPRGGPLRHTAFYERRFKPAVRQALPPHLHGLRFHDLRHTCASLLINPPISANPKAVSERLGHSSVGITLDTYSHLFKGWEEQLTGGLDAIFIKAQQAELAPQPVIEPNSILRRIASGDD